MENKFVDGMIAKAPSDKAPEWIIANVSLKRDELIPWLQGQPDNWINLQLKRSDRSGKLYFAVDQWKPKGDAPERAVPAQRRDELDDGSDSIPF